MTKEPVQIIYLNGPLSRGETTLAKALQHAFEEPFLHLGIDKIIGWMPEKVSENSLQVGTLCHIIKWSYS